MCLTFHSNKFCFSQWALSFLRIVMKLAWPFLSLYISTVFLQLIISERISYDRKLRRQVFSSFIYLRNSRTWKFSESLILKLLVWSPQPHILTSCFRILYPLPLPFPHILKHWTICHPTICHGHFFYLGFFSTTIFLAPPIFSTQFIFQSSSNGHSFWGLPWQYTSKINFFLMCDHMPITITEFIV